MEPSEARALLLTQHQQLRALLNGAHALAERLLGGEDVGGAFAARLDEVRHAFAAHNVSEEALLEPILRFDYAWGPPCIAGMVEGQSAEHASMRELLARAPVDLAARMGELCEDIDAHIAAEERTFLSPAVLRDDQVDLDDGD